MAAFIAGSGSCFAATELRTKVPEDARIDSDAKPITTLEIPPSKPHKNHTQTTAKKAKKITQQHAKAQASTAVTQVQASQLATLSPSAGTQLATAPLPASAQTLPEKAILPLPFKDDDAFAVFIWQKRLWIVAETSTPPALDELRKAGGELVKNAQVLPDSNANITAVSLATNMSATVEKVPPDRVRIVLERKDVRPAQTYTPTLGNIKGQSLFVPAGKATHAIIFRDPLTGSMLNVIPVADPGTGIAPERSFIEFTLLKSAQGIAVQSISDAITVSLQKGTAEITAPGGLTVSAETIQQMQESESEAALARLPPTIFAYARWKLDDEKNWDATQTRLFHDIAFGTQDSANKARLKLLGYYLGEGLFPEAQGMANDILRSSLKFYQANKVSALRGAAYLFLNRIVEAQRDFSAPELKNDPEAQMWRILCDELLIPDSKETFDFSANYDRYISHYPPVFIQKLALIAADRNINRKEYDAADAIFETLKRENLDESVKKYIDFMRGKILSETHGEAEAMKIWETQARDVNDALIRSRAEFSLINLQLRIDKITREEAAGRLEKLRIVWRGDSLELSVLSQLSALYLQNKQYDKALRTMRDIVLYYPQVPEAVTIAREMEETFIMLYNKGGADSMPPLEALSLFYEFRDLVPVGKTGDLMVRNLADRLVNIDLLDRAALLLDHQIKNRLQGEDRSRVGAKLALIYLLNHQPKEALETLKTTGFGDLPADLQLERVRLTARALAQQNKEAKAIEVLSTDNSVEGTLLRLSIYWDNHDWPNVVAAAEDILSNRNDPSAPLTLQESDVLLKLATAYVYEHDAGQLQYLRDYFTPLMKKNPRRESFLFITSESGAVDYDSIGNLDQDIGAVKSFLKNAQDKPGKNGLSKPGG